MHLRAILCVIHSSFTVYRVCLLTVTLCQRNRHSKIVRAPIATKSLPHCNRPLLTVPGSRQKTITEHRSRGLLKSNRTQFAADTLRTRIWPERTLASCATVTSLSSDLKSMCVTLDHDQRLQQAATRFWLFTLRLVSASLACWTKWRIAKMTFGALSERRQQSFFYLCW